MARGCAGQHPDAIGYGIRRWPAAARIGNGLRSRETGVFRPGIRPGHRTAESPRDLAGRLAEVDGEMTPAAAGPREGRWAPAGRTEGPG
jgi:hypothetical protein